MQIIINDKNYNFQDGETVLDICRKNGIRVPTLCAFEGLPREAVCRVCLVEILPDGKLAPSCATKATDGMEIFTESEKVKKARSINMELLWADHAGKCATCKKNKMCELQKMAEEYKIENFRFVPRKGEITNKEELDLLKDNWSRIVLEEKNPCIARTTEFCVECRRCINICPVKAYGFNYRAGDTVVGTPYEKVLDCAFCGECVRACPTAALMDQNNLKKIIDELDDLGKLSVAVVEPEAEKLIIKNIPEINSREKLVGLLRLFSFEKIFFSSDKKGSLDRWAERIKTDYARKEKINPDNIAIVVISMEIIRKAKKDKNIDYILTEREIRRLARDEEIDLKKVKGSEEDKI